MTVLLARKRAGLTQAGLASKLEVTSRTVQNWEGGDEPSGANLLRLAALLDISTDDLYVVEERAA